jgi:katanin p60 ATPase-containing subunit A1
LDDAKEIIQESILLPLLIPEYFTGIRKPLRGVLLYGPPGTGKTMLAKAVATYGKTTFFNVNPSTLAGTWAGEFEKLVRYLFELARFYAPSTIFLDEIDAIGSRRSSKESDWVRKIKTELYIQMDGISKDIGSPQGNDVAMSIIVIGATNRPWDLDEALLRRLERRICNLKLNFRHSASQSPGKKGTVLYEFKIRKALAEYQLGQDYRNHRRLLRG